MDVLRALTERLAKVKLSQDPLEAKALEEWIAGGGLESLKPSLLNELKDISGKSPEPITLDVRRFDEWEKRKFDVYPYNTMAEFKATIMKSYGYKYSIKLRLTYESSGDVVPVDFNPGQTIGEVVANNPFKEGTLQTVILPQRSNPFKGKPFVNIPVRVFTDRDDIEHKDILVPITRSTTTTQLGEEVKKQFPQLEDMMILVDDKGMGRYHYRPWEEADDIGQRWMETGYGYIQLFAPEESDFPPLP